MAKNATKNPFEFGRELNATELVDRRDELRKVLRSMENRGKLFLIGPRRYGKTSLLKAAASKAEEAKIVVLRYDAEAYESLELLAAALLSGAARALAGPLDKVKDALARVAGHLKPEATYDVNDAKLSVTIGAKAPGRGAKRDDLPILADVLDAVEALAKESGRAVVVVIDEFQQVVEEKGATAERQIRSRVQRHEHVGYIFAGSATRLLADMTGDPGRAFYKLGSRLFLGSIPREEFKAFLHAGFTNSGFRIETAALDTILDLAENVPYNVQQLAHQCWEWLREDNSRVLTTSAVAENRDQIVRQENPAYTQIWKSLTRVQKVALKAVVQDDGKNLMSEETTRKYRIGASSMNQALAILDKRALVREEELLGNVRFRLEDPFLGAWLRMVQEQ